MILTRRRLPLSRNSRNACASSTSGLTRHPCELENRTKLANGLLPGTNGLKRARLGRTTLNDVLHGNKFPKKAFLLTLVEALHVDLKADRRWEQAWDRLADQDQQASATLGEADKLRQENDELRRQLAEMQHSADIELEQLRADTEARRTSAEHGLGELRRLLAAAKHQAETAESRASQEQARARAAESQLDSAIRRAATAESLLEWEWKLSGGRFVSVAMPHLGEACTEGTVTGWLKKEGEHVEAGEPLLEVSSGMSSTEILSPATGILRDIAAEDEKVSVGAQLAVIEETRPAGREPSAQAILSMTVIRRLADPAPADSPAPGECPVIMPGPGDAVDERTVTG
jgi:biotin carboxyl carrier protein